MRNRLFLAIGAAVVLVPCQGIYAAPPSHDGKVVLFGNLHSHSRLSDDVKTKSKMWPQDGFEIADEGGLDFLAITDHHKATDSTHRFFMTQEVGEETTAPLTELVDAESANLGMKLKIRVSRGWFKMPPHLVFFARLEEDEGVEDLALETDLIPSTFVAGYHVYLLDVPPGTYVAVAAVRWKENPPDTIPLASVSIGPFTFESYLEIMNDPDVFRYYFSRALIEETKIKVGPRSFSFVGEFVADSTGKVKEADEVQRHFMQMIEGELADKSWFTKSFLYGEYSYLLAPHERDRSLSAEMQFFKKAKKHIREGVWAEMIEERLETHAQVDE